ncbi:uncharacterized [Tachysurus ichikawai]
MTVDQSLIRATSLAHVSVLPSNHQALKSINWQKQTFPLSACSPEIIIRILYHQAVTMAMGPGHTARACDACDVVLRLLPLGKVSGEKFAPSCGLLPTSSGSIFGVLRGGLVSLKR